MKNKNSNLMCYIIAFVIVFGAMAVFGGFNVPNAAGDNIKSTYSCDVKYVSLNTSINTIDKDGNPSYKKKNFSGINGDATPEALATVADAIKLVLANQTRYTLVNEISMLEDNA